MVLLFLLYLEKITEFLFKLIYAKIDGMPFVISEYDGIEN